MLRSRASERLPKFPAPKRTTLFFAAESRRSSADRSRSTTEGKDSLRMLFQLLVMWNSCYSGKGSTIIFARNSSRGKNGHRSSSGFETNEPSGCWTLDRRGARTSSGMT